MIEASANLNPYLSKTGIQSNYNWIGVLQFLQNEYQKNNDRENTWLLEKKTLQTRISELQGELKAADIIAKDLLKRNKMLEFSLKQERMKGSSNAKVQYEDSNPELNNIPKRKPKSNKATLSKILTSLGVKDIFEDIEKEIGLMVPDKSVAKQVNFEKEIKMMSSMEKKAPTPAQAAHVLYKNSATLTGHIEGVRDLFFHPNKNILASVSEDKLIKLWDTTQLSSPSPTAPQAYLTIREHTGPIFSIAGSDDYVFTGGMEGVVYCWSLPSKDDVDPTANYLRGSWENSDDEKQEPVWQLLYNKDDKTLFSTSSDSAIRMYSLLEKPENPRTNQVSAKLKQLYSYRYETSQGFTEQDIPTAICLVDHNPKILVTGFVNTHGLIIFDKQTAKVSSTLKFPAQGQVSTNRILSFPNLLISAHEDKHIRVFDYNKMIYNFQAHDDSVVSLAMLANRNQFFSCSHDATVKLWDIRKFEPLLTLKGHTKKYDEAIHCIANHPNQNLAASGGADSLIKIYTPQ